jgi:hypothetical protein
MRYLQASLIFAGAALLAVPEEAGAQTVYETQPAPAPAPPPAPQPAAPSTTVVVPAQPYPAPMYAPYTGAPVYSPYGVAGHSRRVSRRTSRRVSRRH